MDNRHRHPHSAHTAHDAPSPAQPSLSLTMEAEILSSPAPVAIAAAAALSTPPASASIVWPYLRGVLSGTASGVTKMIVGHPFDTIKVRMQTEGGHGRFSGSLDCLRQTLRNEGLRALYKGATPPLVGWGLIDSLLWGSLVQYRRILHSWQADKSQPLSLPAHFVAGGAAGLTSVVLVTPIEQVKARLQIQYDPSTVQYRGPIDCVRQLLRNNGLRGLYIGGSGTILFRLHMAFYFAGTELLKRRMAAARPDWSDVTLSFLSGGMGANFYWCIAFPSDTIKNKMMAQPDIIPRRYPTILSCCRDIMQTEGVKGFYRGFLPCILRSFPTNGAAFVAAETMLKILPQ